MSFRRVPPSPHMSRRLSAQRQRIPMPTSSPIENFNNKGVRSSARGGEGRFARCARPSDHGRDAGRPRRRRHNHHASSDPARTRARSDRRGSACHRRQAVCFERRSETGVRSHPRPPPRPCVYHRRARSSCKAKDRKAAVVTCSQSRSRAPASSALPPFRFGRLRRSSCTGADAAAGLSERDASVLDAVLSHRNATIAPVLARQAGTVAPGPPWGALQWVTLAIA